MRFGQFKRLFSILSVLGSLVVMASAAWAAVTAASPGSSELVVNTVDDEPDTQPGDGQCQTLARNCTLRAALEEANALPGPDSIAFNISGAGPHTILPKSPLPTITEAVIIDGQSEPDYMQSPVIFLDGSLAGEQASGLTITSGDSLVRGLAIYSFEYSGIYLLGGSSNRIENNYLGTTGKLAQGNHIGILVEKSALNIIGDPGAGNLISSNEVGVYLYGLGASENTVAGNLIGTDADGVVALGNEYGVRITFGDGNLVGGNDGGDRNVITGNDTGIYIQGQGASGNRIWGNYIGLDASGESILGNKETGVYILDAPGNQVGGPNSRGNVIAGGELGVYVRGPGSKGNLLRNNLIGTDSNQRLPMQRLSGGVLVAEASSTVIGGTQVNQGNHIVTYQYGIRLRGIAVDSTATENNTLDVLSEEPEDEDNAEANAVSLLPAAANQNMPTWTPEGRRPRSAYSLSKVSAHPFFQSGTTFTVNTTGDGSDANVGDGICADSSGNCTLRAAIEEANTTTALDIVAFNISGTGPHTIQPNSALPVIRQAVVFDGTTEPDFAGTPVVELDGSNAGANISGLNVQVANSTIRGLVINRFDNDGIWLDTEAVNTVIEGNFIGTNVSGTVALGNLDDGITLWETADVTIGGVTTATRNLISGNAENGIAIYTESADDNVIQGNIIGLDVNGTADLGNGYDGIHLTDGGDGNMIGGTTTGAGNLISGNGDDGIELEASATGNVIQGNRIGTDASGTAALGNSDRGIELDDAANNIIGGTIGAARNLISGNSDDGIALQDATTAGNLIQGNYIGTNANGTTALGNSDDGIYVFSNAGSNTIGGTTSGAGNLISGNGEDGIELESTTAGSVIQGNLIGVDVAGTVDIGNSDRGIELDNAPNNVIGGTTAAARNLISGNNDDGLGLTGASTTGNLIQGNYIGTNISGTVALGNSSDGIYVFSSAAENTIGGAAIGAGNLISGNGGDGIKFGGGTTGMIIQGNFIGTDASGSAALGNGNMGIVLYDSPNNTLGGTADGAGNLVSGNTAHGINLTNSGSVGNMVQGNLIGTAVDEVTPLGNGRRGVSIYAGANENIIGGLTTGNTIAYNNEEGVYVDSTCTENAIRANEIFSNTNLGIDLSSLGVTSNDSGDSDTGANLRQNYPVLVQAVTSYGTTIISGTLNSTANLTFTLDFYGSAVCDPIDYGEGQYYLGSDVVATDGSGNVSFTSTVLTGAADNPIMTATATDLNGNTSEFSACITATVTETEPVADFLGTPVNGMVPLTVLFNDNSTGTVTNYAWDFGDGGAAATANPIYVYEAPGIYTVTLAVSGPGGNDSETKPNYVTVTEPLSRAWQVITTTTTPTVWGEYSLVYDSGRDVTVLYGGNADGWPYENSTWEFDGTDWSPVTTNEQPSAVYGMSMIYDSSESNIVLFGGSDSTDTALAETWVYSGIAWIQLALGITPPARTNAAMVYDSTSDVTYLFGGQDTATYFNDLWQFNGATWSQVTVNGGAPLARALHSLAYNSAAHELILFGGRSSSGTQLGDTWVFDLTTNTWSELAISGPAARQAQAMVYDPTRDVVVLAGGVANDGDMVLIDVWHLGNGIWTEVAAVPISVGLAYHQMIYDSMEDAILLLANGETWQYK